MLSGTDLFLLLATPWLVGCGGLRLLGIRWRDDPYAWHGLAWLAGTLTVALLLWGWLFTGLSIDAFLSVPRVLAVAALAVLVAGRVRRRAPAPPRESSRFGRVERAVFFAVVAGSLVLTIDRAVRANAESVVLLSDEASIWAGKAKAIYLAGGFNDRFGAIARPDIVVLHKDYPVLNPLLQVYAFAHAGRVLDVANRWPIQAFIAALILVAAGALLHVCRPWLAALFLVLVVTTFQLALTTGLVEADGLVVLGFLTALHAWSRLDAGGGAGWWRLCTVALAFLAWSKNEGFLLALAVLLAIGLTLHKRRRHGAPSPLRSRDLAWLLLPALVVVLHLVLNQRFGFQNDIMAEQGSRSFLGRVVLQAPRHGDALLRSFLEHGVRRVAETHLLFPLCLALLVLFPRRLGRHAPVLTLSCALAAAGYTLIYLGTPREIEWHLRWSIQRILWQLQPPVLLWVASATQRLLDAGWGRARVE